MLTIPEKLWAWGVGKNRYWASDVEVDDSTEYTRSDLIPTWHSYPAEKPKEGGHYFVALNSGYEDEARYEEGKWVLLDIDRATEEDITNHVVAWHDPIKPYDGNNNDSTPSVPGDRGSIGVDKN